MMPHRKRMLLPLSRIATLASGARAILFCFRLSAESVDLFPPDRPADVSPGLEAIIDPSSHGGASLCFTELDRLQWLPPREIPVGYDGLCLVAKVDGSDRIGHHVCSTTQLEQRQRLGPMATGRVSRRGCIGSMAYADASPSVRPLVLTPSPKPQLMR